MLLVIDQARVAELEAKDQRKSRAFHRLVRRLSEQIGAADPTIAEAAEAAEDPRPAYPYSSYLPTPILVFSALRSFTVSNPIH